MKKNIIGDFNILELIQYIVCYATEKGVKLSPIRLVKFLYLADLYWARENNGKILTPFLRGCVKTLGTVPIFFLNNS
jgi:hypothetical protein